jgi:hypothetical protein
MLTKLADSKLNKIFNLTRNPITNTGVLCTHHLLKPDE